MASFNNTPQAQITPNYTGASQGIHASPNTALGDLFQNLAGVLDAGIKEADRATQEGIQNEIFDQVDAIQDEFGVSSATLFQEDPGSTAATPPALADSGRHLQGLQAQYERGALKESHYWARMNSMVRQLRGRYPGYRAEIDSMVSSIVGARPANALRNALMSEWKEEANAGNQALKDYNNLVEWALKSGTSQTGRSYLPMDFFERQATGNPYSMVELQSHISQVTSAENIVTARRNQMAEAATQDSLTTRQVERAWAQEATSFVNDTISDIGNSLGKQYADIRSLEQEIRNAASSGDPGSEEQVRQLSAMVSQLQGSLLDGLNKKFTESWDGDPSHSYASQLDDATRQSIINTAMAPIALIQDSINNKDYGIANSVMNYTKAKQNDINKELLDKIPFMGLLGSLKEFGGPDFPGFFMQLGGAELQGTLTKVLKDASLVSMGTGDGSVVKYFDLGEEAGEKKEYYDSLITQWQNVANQVVSGKLPPDVVANSVNFMFGQEALGILGRMTPESRYQYFKKVASPAVSNQMLALKKAGDIDSWNTYQNWVTSSFITLFRSAVSDLPGAFPNTQGISVTWDKTTNGFKVTGDVSQSSSQNLLTTPLFSIPSPTAGLETEVFRNLKQNKIADLNSAIRVIAPIIEANGGDVTEELYDLLLQMGYNPNKPKDPTVQQTIEMVLGDAIVHGLKAVGVIGDTTGTKFEAGVP